MAKNNASYVLGYVIGYIVGTSLLAVAFIALLVVLIMQGFAGMLIAVVALVIIGGFLAYMDERHAAQQYKDDTECS